MPTPVALRALGPGDAAAARALARAEVGGTPYAERPLELLDELLDELLGGEAPGDEARGIVAVRGDEPVGLALYGLVAGTRGTGRLHLVVVTAGARLAGVGRALCDAAADELRARGARVMVAEMPDDAATAAGRELLRRAGFREEGRVADYFRDGVALLLLRRDL